MIDADDIANEVFFGAFHNLHTFHGGPQSFSRCPRAPQRLSGGAQILRQSDVLGDLFR